MWSAEEETTLGIAKIDHIPPGCGRFPVLPRYGFVGVVL